jgi:hypothetical protein
MSVDSERSRPVCSCWRAGLAASGGLPSMLRDIAGDALLEASSGLHMLDGKIDESGGCPKGWEGTLLCSIARRRNGFW